MHFVLLKSITLFHTLFLAFTIISPVLDINYFLLLHSVFIPFMILHWVTNDNTCVLTITERNIKKKIYGEKYTDDECFTCKIINPIYDFKKNNISYTKVIYTVTIMLWFISCYKLYDKYQHGKITKWENLFSMKSLLLKSVFKQYNHNNQTT